MSHKRGLSINTLEIEETTNNLEQMSNTYYENQEYFGSPSQYELPSQFFEKICDLENSLLVDKDLVKIENLARLYKIGVEYYSGINSVKESDYLFKLQTLFSNKHLSHFYNPGNDNKHVSTNARKKARYNFDLAMAQLDTEANSASLILSKAEIVFNNALGLINKDILAQEKSMYENMKKKRNQMMLFAECKLTPNCRKTISFIPDNSGNIISSISTPKDKVKINFGSTKLNNNNELRETMYKMSNQNTSLEYSTPNRRLSTGLKVNKKFTSFLTSLTEIIEKFQSDYHSAFGNLIFTPFCNKFLMKLEEHYDKKINNFEYYEDQIKELNMMLDGNDNNESNNTLSLMIENLYIEKNKIDYDLQMEQDNEMQDYFTEQSKEDLISKGDFFKKINIELSLKIHDLLVNNDTS